MNVLKTLSGIELEHEVDKLGGMKKRPRKQSRKYLNRHAHPRVAFHLPEDYLDALRDLAKKNKRTLTAELLLALEKHLWPEGKPEQPE
jgi:hypothetical protein